MVTKEKPVRALPDHFSWSSLRLHGDCPGAWCDKYLRGIEEEETEPQIFGSAFHALSAAYDEHCKSRLIGNDYTVVDPIFDHYIGTHPEALPQATEIKGLFTEYVHGQVVDYAHLVASEWPLETMVAGHRVIGVVDRIYMEDDELTIRDLKTDGAIRSQAEVDRDTQLGMYAAFAADHYQWPNPVRVEMMFVRYGVIRRSIRDGEAIQEIRDKIAHQIGIIGGAYAAMVDGLPDAFPYTVGARCSWCGYASRCPTIAMLAADEGKISPVTAIEAAMVLGRAMIALTERLKCIKKALQPWCSEHGNLEINGLGLGYHKTESYEYPVAVCADILKAHKEDPLCYMRIDSTAIKKAMKGDDKLREAFERVREDRSYTTFAARKIKGGDE